MEKNEYTIFVTGPLASNTCLVYNESGHCVVIDPAADCGEVIRFIESNAFVLQGILLTHGHFDHIAGIPEVLEKFPDIPVYLHRLDMFMLKNADMNGSCMFAEKFTYDGPVLSFDEGEIVVGAFKFTALHVPGHTPGGAAFLIDEVCFCGDSLFAGSIGRSDFPGGDGDLLIRKIEEKLLNLPPETTVCPGHGGRTTIGREKRLNPFLA